MISRDSVVRGPGRIVVQSQSFFSKGDFAIENEVKTFNIENSAHGIVEARDDDFEARIGFEPDGRLTAEIIAILWPYASSLPGARLLSATDRPMAIHTAESHLITLVTCGLFKMPDLILSANKTAIGQCEWVGLRANGQDVSAADKLLTAATTGGTFTDSTFDPSEILTQPYTAAFTGTGLTSFESEDGFRITFDASWDREPLDQCGTFNYRLQNVGCRVRFKPVGPSADNILDALRVQGTGAARGASRRTGSADLVITGLDGTTVFTLKNANFNRGQFGFGSNALRTGEVEMVGMRSFTIGVPGPLWTFVLDA